MRRCHKGGATKNESVGGYGRKKVPRENVQPAAICCWWLPSACKLPSKRCKKCAPCVGAKVSDRVDLYARGVWPVFTQVPSSIQPHSLSVYPSLCMLFSQMLPSFCRQKREHNQNRSICSWALRAAPLHANFTAPIFRLRPRSTPTHHPPPNAQGRDIHSLWAFEFWKGCQRKTDIILWI